MLIQTLPPRRMWRVMAIRADSICRFVTYAGSRAWMPYSPKTTFVPPLAAPERPGWCCLRCLTRRGMSIGSALLGSGGGGVGRLRGGVVRGGNALVDRGVGRLAAGDPLRGRGVGRTFRTAGDGRRTAIDGSRTAAGRAVAAAGTAVTLVTRTQCGSRRLLLAGQHLV